MNLKKVSDGLHKLNTSQIIALGFAGVIFVGGFILVAAVLQWHPGRLLPSRMLFLQRQPAYV